MGQKKSKNRVGLTAFYTAAVWASLKVPGAGRFLTWRGRFLHGVVSLGGATVGLFGGYSVTNLYLAGRQLGLDRLLAERQPTQVIELAAGLSSRGWEMTRRQAVRYIEVDQPAVLNFKNKLIAADPRPLAPGAEYHNFPFDLAAPAGLVAALKPFISPAQPALIICAGLTGYLSQPELTGFLQVLLKLAQSQPNTSILLDFGLKLNRADHKRAYFGMLPGSFTWKLLGAPPRLFLRDQAQLENWLKGLGFEIKRLFSSQELAKLAGLKPPPVIVFYMAELKAPSPGVL